MKKEFDVICKNCGKHFKVIEEELKFPIKGDKYFCCRSCANTRHHSEETKNKISKGVKNSDKFLINNSLGKHESNCFKTIDEIRKTKCKICGNYFMPNYTFNGLYYKIIDHKSICSSECKSKYYSIHNKLSHTGGFNEGSVKNYKSGWYDGIHFDSSWELAFYIYSKEHNIKIERCKEVRKYIIDNEEHEFHPDFVINNQIYEIKGIKSKNSEAKQKYNQDIKFLYRNDIKQYLDYVIKKYGKNFIDLYENKDKVGA